MFYEHVLRLVTGQPFANADVITRESWPDSDQDSCNEGAQIASGRRESLTIGGQPFAGAVHA